MPIASVTNAVLGHRYIDIPVQLSAFSTSAASLVDGLPLRFAGNILSAEFVITKAGAGTSASQTFQVQINGTDVTGLSKTLALAATTLGAVVAFGTKTGDPDTNAGGRFKAGDTLSVTIAASGTVYTAGDGVLKISVEKTDGQ